MGIDIDIDMEGVGVTECINSTPSTVNAISNPVAGAVPRRARRTTGFMIRR